MFYSFYYEPPSFSRVQNSLEIKSELWFVQAQEGGSRLNVDVLRDICLTHLTACFIKRSCPCVSVISKGH